MSGSNRRLIAVRSASLSHRGHVRPTNQDAYVEWPQAGLWGVADGMGGLAKGERASRAVVEALAALDPGDGLAARAEAALARVNDDLCWEAAMGEDGRAMGSTAVVLVVDGSTFTCLWVGDSRLYLWRAGLIRQVTRDHTPLQNLIDAGLTFKGGRGMPKLDHVVDRAIGIAPSCPLDRVGGRVEPGDVFLLCTDGLTKTVDATAIGAALACGDPALAARTLLDAALAAGGPDNVTVLVATASASFSSPS